jgi:hypothetical protein
MQLDTQRAGAEAAVERRRRDHHSAVAVAQQKRVRLSDSSVLQMIRRRGRDAGLRVIHPIDYDIPFAVHLPASWRMSDVNPGELICYACPSRATGRRSYGEVVGTELPPEVALRSSIEVVTFSLRIRHGAG